MLKKLILIVFISLVSCNKNDNTLTIENSSYAYAADQMYEFLRIYKDKEGIYPEKLEDLKNIFIYNESNVKVWDELVHNKWTYEKPDPSKISQIILRDHKYGIFVRVQYVNGEMTLDEIRR